MSWQFEELTPLSEFAEIKHGFAFPSEFFGDSGSYLLLTPGNFNEAGGFRDLGESQKRYSGPVPSNFILDAGDVLVAMTEQSPGLLGSTIRIPRGNTYLHNQRLGLVTIRRPECLSKQYLYHLFNAPYVRKEISTGSSGTKVKHTSPTKLCSISVFIPTLPEQRMVTSILDNWDIAIEKTERLIAAKVRAKDAYGIFLLAAKHPDFRREDELFTPVSEKGRDDLQILSVTQDQGVIPRALLDKKILMEASNVSAFKVVREGDFVISLRSFQGGLEYSPYEGVVSPAYTVLRPRKEVYPEFFRHYLKSKDFLKRLSVAVIGIRDGKQINFSDFASIKLPVPPRVAQVQYAKLFDAMEREIALLKTQKDGLQKQKRGLMQKLLTGQWRVTIPTSQEISDA